MNAIRRAISGRVLSGVEAFFFARRSAWPFGLMRATWAGVALIFLLRQWFDVTAFYSDDGFLPRDLVYLVTRDDWRFSILDYSGEVWYVWAWYITMLVAFACSMLGIAPRTSTIASFLLLSSFHERDAMTLGGGDTVLRNVGFILAIAPGIEAFSFSRLRRHYASWKKTKTLLPPVTMSAWPYRLLLWQMMVLYITSLWWKLLGDMWLDGTAVGAALHHSIFLNWPYGVINEFMPFAAYLTHATVFWEASWLLLLVPSTVWKWTNIPVKRLVLAGGLAFHGGIAVFMDVGVFPYVLFAAYLGLLDDGDRAWLKRLIDRRSALPIVVLYDGSCRLCRRSAFGLRIMDTFSHLHLVDFRNAAEKKKVAPHLDEAQLDLTMHILLPDDSVRTGFDAFRFLTWHLPTLWLAAPFLYLPGVSHLGRAMYAWVAQNRQKCAHDRC